MKDSVILQSSLLTRGSSLPVSERLARAFVLRLAARIGHGRITVVDPLGSVSIGAETAELPLSVTLTISDLRFWSMVALRGSVGAGEAYMMGFFSCSDLVALVRILVGNRAAMSALDGPLARVTQPLYRAFHRLRKNTPSGSRDNIRAHYDLGNDFYALFLDETMSYSAGVFEREDSTLLEASIAKNERVCCKLDLGPGDHLLEIGTGWGGLAVHAASRFGCRVTTVTLSEEQHALAWRRVVDAGLDGRVDVRLCDYRSIEGRFDKVVSIEMIEAVGHEYYPVFFAKLAALLAPDGVALIQSITIADQQYEASKDAVDFIKRYIFPGSCIPSVTALCAVATRASDLRLTHLEDITPHYALTLRHWRQRFLSNAERVREQGFPDSFVRMWEFYLAYCEAGFSERYIGDVQLVFDKPGRQKQTIVPPMPRLDRRPDLEA